MRLPNSISEMLAIEAGFKRISEQMRKEFNDRMNSNFPEKPNIGDTAWDFYTDRRYILTDNGWIRI